MAILTVPNLARFNTAFTKAWYHGMFLPFFYFCCYDYLRSSESEFEEIYLQKSALYYCIITFIWLWFPFGTFFGSLVYTKQIYNFYITIGILVCEAILVSLGTSIFILNLTVNNQYAQVIAIQAFFPVLINIVSFFIALMTQKQCLIFDICFTSNIKCNKCQKEIKKGSYIVQDPNNIYMEHITC